LGPRLLTNLITDVRESVTLGYQGCPVTVDDNQSSGLSMIRAPLSGVQLAISLPQRHERPSAKGGELR